MPRDTNGIFAFEFTAYKEAIRNYVGSSGNASGTNSLFACPADTFYYEFTQNNGVNRVDYHPASFHEQATNDYSSYWFNSGVLLRTGTNSPGLTGTQLSSIKHPSRTVLVAEMPAFIPWSWHKPKQPLPVGSDWPLFNDAMNVASFVDGHVNYIRIFWQDPHSPTFSINPPEGYDYQWSGN